MRTTALLLSSVDLDNPTRPCGYTTRRGSTPASSARQSLLGPFSISDRRERRLPYSDTRFTHPPRPTGRRPESPAAAPSPSHISQLSGLTLPLPIPPHKRLPQNRHLHRRRLALGTALNLKNKQIRPRAPIPHRIQRPPRSTPRPSRQPHSPNRPPKRNPPPLRPRRRRSRIQPNPHLHPGGRPNKRANQPHDIRPVAHKTVHKQPRLAISQGNLHHRSIRNSIIPSKPLPRLFPGRRLPSRKKDPINLLLQPRIRRGRLPAGSEHDIPQPLRGRQR